MSWKYNKNQIDSITTSAGLDMGSAQGGVRPSARLCHTGGEPAIATTSGTDATPVITEIYLAEVFVPATVLVTGVAIFNGSAVTDDVKVGLYDSAGTLLATNATGGAGTTQSGTDAYQRVPFTATEVVPGPATYYVGIIFDGTTSRFNAHTVGNFGAGKLTGHVYATAMETTATSSLTMPTTFTTALGPIASLYYPFGEGVCGESGSTMPDYTQGTSQFLMATPSLASLNSNGTTDFRLPPFDKITFTYIASGAADDDDISTAVYSLGGTTVATITYVYVGSTNNVSTATMTIP